jgi:hypothetical protein
MHCPQLILGFFGIQQLGAQKLLLWQLVGWIPGNPSKVQGRVETCGNYWKILKYPLTIGFPARSLTN